MNDDSIVWTDSYSVGVSAMDEQHKKLVDLINNIFQMCQKENPGTKADFARAFRGVSEYALTHFSEEEAFLQKSGYPDLPDQKKEHAAFISEIWGQLEKFNKDSAAPLELLHFLKKWLLNHIAVKDKKYGAYLANK